MSSESITCQELASRITLYLEGALSSVDREHFEAHSRACSTCSTRLAQMRTVVGSLGRFGDRREAATGPEKERVLRVFREHGLHTPGPRPRHVPLGLGEAAVAPGDHLAYFWESDQEYEAGFGFLATGARQGATSILLGQGEDNLRAEAGLRRAGIDPSALRTEGRLHHIPGHSSGLAILGEIEERIKAAVDRGEPLVRIFGSLGWGRPGWPTDQDILRLEACMTEAICRLPAIVMCAYETRGTPGREIHVGGLECHPWAFRRGVLMRNDQYVPAETFLASLEREHS